MINKLKRAILFFVRKENKKKYIEDFFNYSISKFNIEFNFNIAKEISSEYKVLYISKKELNFIKKNINKIDYDYISKWSNNKMVFCVESKIFESNFNKFMISYVINSNSLLKIVDSLNCKDDNFLKVLKKSIKKNKLIHNNDKKVLNYIANLTWRKKSNLIFYNYSKTFDDIFKKNIIRIGDGELDLVSGENHPYQKYNDEIKTELLEVINYFIHKKSIALNDKIIAPYYSANDRHFYQDMNINYNLEELNILEAYSANVWSIPPYIMYNKVNNYLFQPMSFDIDGKSVSILSKDYYIKNKNELFYYNKFIDHNFNKLKGKKIIVITSEFNEKSFKMFFQKYSSDINFIFSPEQNSYDKKDLLLDEIKKYITKYNKKKILFLIATGPCGKILGKFIDEQNYNFIDIGNFINYYNHYNNFNTIENISDIHNIDKFKKAIKNR